MESFIPTCKETGIINIPAERIQEAVLPTVEKRLKLKDDTSVIPFSKSLIGDYPTFSENQIQQIFSRLIEIIDTGERDKMLQYMRNVLGTPLVEFEDIFRFFVLNGYTLNIGEAKLHKINNISTRKTPQGNNYILVDSDYTGGATTLNSTDGKSLPIVTINHASNFSLIQGGLQSFLINRFPNFEKFIPRDTHFQSEVMSGAVLSNEEAHVDFNKSYDVSRRDELLCMEVNGYIPSVDAANEYLSDVRSFKTVGAGFLIQSITYDASHYTLQSEIMKYVFHAFGVEFDGNHYENIDIILAKGHSPEDIVNAFLAWEEPVRKALEPFRI